MRKKRLLAVYSLAITLAASGCAFGPGTTETSNHVDVTEQIETTSEITTEEPTTEAPPTSAMIHGEEYSLDSTSLDLSECTSDDIPEIIEALNQMPSLEKVNLMKGNDSSSFTPDDVRQLLDAAPAVKFIYRFDLFGKRLSIQDTVVKYVKDNIGNDGADEIRQALSILRKCELFVLDDCGIDDAVMAGIRDEFPDTKVVWRIHVGNQSALTDDTIIRMTHGVDDSMTEPLKYCTETVYMDIGHDEGISDISFVSEMPKLECIILSGSSVSDISPLMNCPNLTWLELNNCASVSDLSLVSGNTSVKYLNISSTKIRDISPANDMKLERFCCIGNGVSQEQIDAFCAANPDCMTSFTGNPWGYAWRYDDHGYTYFSYYARMREVFRYDTTSPGGFKYPEYVEPENTIDSDDIVI
ncbi:MAG: hypothetical protein K6E28_03695 [Eubacterium sp.]|nr:hypothetical protein [Eubacterium sp.]